jgi:hypothetical protein
MPFAAFKYECVLYFWRETGWPGVDAAYFAELTCAGLLIHPNSNPKLDHSPVPAVYLLRVYLFPCPTTTPFCIFQYLIYSRVLLHIPVSCDYTFCRFCVTYSCTYLELFPRMQWMKVHDLAKCEWLLFIEWKWVESMNRIVVYND